MSTFDPKLRQNRPRTLNTKAVGGLGLTDTEENQLVSFMQTLSDGYMSRD
jgi:hypothetical protein